MTRRFQFSLRSLLALAAVVCMALGGCHLLKYVKATAAETGDTILVEGRLVCPFGPPKIGFHVYLQGQQGYQFGSYKYVAVRSWLGIYEVTAEIEQHELPPGRYVLTLAADETWHESATCCNVTVEAP